MPRSKINNYTFYKIVCLDNSVDLCYVGSTANFLKRKNKHKGDCNNEKGKGFNNKLYTTIREHGGWSNFKMIEIATEDQLSLREAEKIEEDYRQELKANMNTRKCYITYEDKKNESLQYYYDHKEDVLNKKKIFYENNKDRLKEKNLKYYYENKEKILQQNKDKNTKNSVIN